MNGFRKVTETWLRYESAILAGLLFGCGIVIGAVLATSHIGKF